jgi:CRP/FNR family cyclic AMP-dependent transcriptional regulator
VANHSALDNRAALQRVPLFSVLQTEQLDVVGRVVVRDTFSKNRTIFVAGQPSDSLYVILKGRVKIQMSDAEGKEVILAVLGPGEFFGEMSLIDDQPRSATVVSIESCEFLMVRKDDFRRCLTENLEMASLIMRGLVKRLREADRKIESLALLDVYGRVARVLLEFSEMENGRRVLRDKLQRQDVAKMIGASREMVSRVMKGLETDGFLLPQADGSFILQENRNATL